MFHDFVIPVAFPSLNSISDGRHNKVLYSFECSIHASFHFEQSTRNCKIWKAMVVGKEPGALVG